MENGRVTEIANPHCPQDHIKGGTGYLVGKNLILTARHILTDAKDGIPLELAKPYHVRFWGDFERGKNHEWQLSSATLCWESPRFDLALLRYKDDRPAFLTENVSNTQFGVLGDEELLAKGLGFPTVQKIENVQNPEPLRGNLSGLAGRKTGQVRLQVTSLVPDRPEKWAGISGTALFVNNYLVGVVTDTNQGFGERALWAVPIALVVEEDEEFCRLIFGEGKEPVLQSLPITGSQNKTNSDFVVSVPSFSTYDPKTFTGREELISALLSKLQGQTRLVWITGMSGIGKTTLGECVASRAWESDRSFQWVYLEILEGQSPDFGSVAAELLGKMGDVDLDPQLRNNPEQIAQRLIQRLKSSPYWIQLDSLERLLNPEQPTEFVDAYWAVFLRCCLTESNLSSRLVLTSQVFPIALGEFADRYPKTWTEYRLAGLVGGQRLEFFAKRGVESSHGDILSRIAQTYEGHPLVLKVMAEEILQEFEGDVLGFWREYQREFEGVTRELSGSGLAETEYNEALDRKVRERLKKSLLRLPQDALDLLCRSAVFRRPVPKKFWLGMMGDRTPQEQKRAYGVLGDHALIEKEGRAIRQHNLIRDLAYNLLKADPDAWQVAERQAAHLWLTVYQPAVEDTNLEKVRGYLEAIDHYAEVEDWEKTKELFTQEINTAAHSTLSRQLDMWGYYQEEISLCKKLLDKCGDEIDVKCWNNIGNGYIDLGNYSETTKAYENSLKIAREIGDRQGEGIALGNLGNAYRRLGQYDRAIDFYQQYLTIAREIGNRRGEGNALGNLGLAYRNLGQYDQAIDFHQQALTIAREIGDRQGEGADLGSLGNAYNDLGQYDRAINFHQQALIISREIGNRQGEGADLGNLGLAYRNLGQYDRAIDFHQQHLTIAREIGDRQGGCNALGSLGNAYNNLGQYDRAIDFYQQQLTITREIGDRQGEGITLGNLGVVYDSLGQYDRAIDFYQQQLTITREIGDRQGKGIALGNLGSTFCALGDYVKALELQNQKLVITRELGNRGSESYALSGLGEVFIKLGQYADALKVLQNALEICQETGNKSLEAEVLKNLAELHQALGEVEVAQQYCQQALALATELGIPLAAECEALLLEIDSKI